MPLAPSQARVARSLPGAIVALALLSAIAVAAKGPSVVGGPTAPPPSAMLAQRTLTFADRDDGAVTVSEDGRTIAVFQGEQGFLRGILRTLARTRVAHHLPLVTPFVLTEWADGRVTLDDREIDNRVELEAFGPTNAGVFLTLLPRPAQPGRPA